MNNIGTYHEQTIGAASLFLASRIELYLKRTGMRPTRFGRDVMRDPRFVFDLRRGRQPGTATVTRVTRWLDRREPEKRA